MTKYEFSQEVYETNRLRLINQLWKLVPMRENGENWQAHLMIIIEELAGLVKIYKDKLEGLILLSKLEGLVAKDTDFMLYRKTIFKSIDLLSRMMENEQSRNDAEKT